MIILVEILVVSQFTLHAIVSKNRPDFHKAMKSEDARQCYDHYVSALKGAYNPSKIQTGEFGGYMKVISENDGPVTFLME